MQPSTKIDLGLGKQRLEDSQMKKKNSPSILLQNSKDTQLHIELSNHTYASAIQPQ